MEGWIKLHRKLKDHWIWKSDNRLKWWIDILMTVNHEDTKVLIKGTLIECKMGQSIRSLESWGRDWNVSKGAVRDFFKLLQNDSMLHTESLQVTTRITVCNYVDYQTSLHTEKTPRKRNKNVEETLALPKQEVIDKSITKNGAEIIKDWKNDFEIYKEKCSKSFELIEINEDLKKRVEELYPNIDYVRSVKKAFYYWITEKGWDKKRKSGSETIDWKSTILKTIQFNIINL